MYRYKINLYLLSYLISPLSLSLFFFILSNMSHPEDTATTANTSEAPVLQVSPKDTVTEPAPVNHTATTAATATGVNATGPKTTPVQRLSSVYKKAKQTVTDAVAEANKAINEKKVSKPATTTATDADAAAAAPAGAATTAEDPVTTTSEAPTATHEKKVGTSSVAFKDLLARIKVNQNRFFLFFPLIECFDLTQ